MTTSFIGHHDGKTIVEMKAEKPQGEGGVFEGDPDYDDQGHLPSKESEGRVKDLLKKFSPFRKK